MNKKNQFVYMRHACTLRTPTFNLSDGALNTRANKIKPQHQFGVGCQVMMAEGGEKSDENVVQEDLVV